MVFFSGINTQHIFSIDFLLVNTKKPVIMELKNAFGSILPSVPFDILQYLELLYVYY